MRSFQYLTAAAFVSFNALLASCGSSKEQPKAGESKVTQPMHGKHWVQNDRLRTLMKDISLRTQASWPQGLPGDAEDGVTSPEAAFSDAADLADSLAANAMRIPDSVSEIPMSQADKAGFNAEAFTLHEQAVALKKAAKARKLEPMQRQLDAISSTCISCHTRFRDFTGELDVTRVNAD